MAVNMGRNTGSRSPLNYVTTVEPLVIPRTPLESRQGYHPKSDDHLKWKTPPSRQLSHQKRVEYELDVKERFYDDYIGNRSGLQKQFLIINKLHIFLEDTSSNTKVTPKTVSLSLSHISPMCVETSPSDLVCGFYMNQIHEVLKCKMVIVGDANNEVLTTSEVAKLKFDPSLYRVNAYQGLAYDPMRPVPAGLDFNVILQQQKMREKQSQVKGHRQRHLSEPIQTNSRTVDYYATQYPPAPCQHPPRSGSLHFPPIRQQAPRSALQQSLNEVISPEVAPAIKKWLLSANKKDQEVAANFFRTISSHGQKPDPASKASVHRSRVRSAVMTPARKEMATQSTYNKMSREVAMMEKQGKSVRKAEPPPRHHQLCRSSSEKGWTAKGSVFTSMK